MSRVSVIFGIFEVEWVGVRHRAGYSDIDEGMHCPKVDRFPVGQIKFRRYSVFQNEKKNSNSFSGDEGVDGTTSPVIQFAFDGQLCSSTHVWWMMRVMDSTLFMSLPMNGVSAIKKLSNLILIDAIKVKM